MSLRKSAWTAAAIGVVLVLVFGIFLFRQTVEVTRFTSSVLTTYDPALGQSAVLERAISEMQRGVANFLLTHQESDLNPFFEGSRASELALEQLEELLGQDEQLVAAVHSASIGRQQWLDEVATPTIEAVRADQQAAALAIWDDPASEELYSALQSDAASLREMIAERREAAFSDLTMLSYRLIWGVVLIVVLLWVSLMFGFYLTLSRVLQPLDELRRQIRSVARRGEHTRTISPTGPAELKALGADVERLRRHLVSEIDEARSAREALDQKAPVVAAIRAELAAGNAVAVPGLAISGALQPAEGVLAGDWWDSAVLPTGEAAVVVADISGHGAEAGIAAMQLKHAIQHDLLLGRDIGEMAMSSAEVFQAHPDRFATVAAVCVNPVTGHIRYINAGHHEPLVVDQGGLVVETLVRTGPILSWLGGQWDIGTTVLQPGHTLILYSDGLIESHDFAGNELGEALLYTWLAEMPDDQREPDSLVPWLMGAARQRAVDWNRDDVTIVAVRRAEDEQVGVRAKRRRMTGKAPLLGGAHAQRTQLRQSW